MDRPLEGAVVIGPVGGRWVVAHVAAGLQQGEATVQVVVVGGGGGGGGTVWWLLA